VEFTATRRRQRRRAWAFAVQDLVVVLFVVALAGAGLIRQTSRLNRKTHLPILECYRNLKAVGDAFRRYAMDHEDQFPMGEPASRGGTLELARAVGAGPLPSPVYPHFLALSNYLTSPKSLACPSDRKTPAESWRALSNDTRVSYFTVLNANPLQPQGFLAGDGGLTNNWTAQNVIANGDLLERANRSLGWPGTLHMRGQGAVVAADGSVQSFNSRQFEGALRQLATGAIPQRLLLPVTP